SQSSLHCGFSGCVATWKKWSFRSKSQALNPRCDAMAWYFALTLMVGSIFVLMTIGVPIAFAFFFTNLIGAFIFLGGEAGIGAFIRGSMSAIANFNLAPIPFFLLIGEILLRTGLAYKAVDAIDNAIQRVPGRLSVVAVTGGTVFSALSGSTIATTAMLGGFGPGYAAPWLQADHGGWTH